MIDQRSSAGEHMPRRAVKDNAQQTSVFPAQEGGPRNRRSLP
ncbi:hypothetical protein STRIP9103_06636 [Streptomyces ipomoeae 91-03]|uniref:Uncharacterized protein n=1 Tax=Streptomyces ipomoeae 91-03 TaxID=698759 RepID=L1KQ24_9ACTN|nr:hypothetical protein STRIP9103_06636 [Streptomyces ipomoeae 91-03]